MAEAVEVAGQSFTTGGRIQAGADVGDVRLWPKPMRWSTASRPPRKFVATVTERTREIGIRKAIGASRADISFQFMLEAVMLSVIGGVAGILFGYLVCQIEISGFRAVIEPASVALAFGFALAVGLFFGIYPATRAASLRPIDALRYE